MTSPRIWILTAALALVACALLLPGCGEDEIALIATLTTPAAPAKGAVRVEFTLADPDGAPASVRLELSTNGGLSYRPATISGATDGLSTGGETHGVDWDSLADLGAVAETVVLRLIPSNAGGEGQKATSDAFAVDNTTGDGNAPPTVAISDPVGEKSSGSYLPKATYHGHVLVTFELADAESDASDVTPLFSLDGGASWAAASSADGGALTGLAPGTHRFLWDSKADVGDVETEARVRLVASDGKPGPPGTTGYLPIDNTELIHRRGPYLQDVHPDSIRILWTTDPRTTAVVRYGTSPDGLTEELVLEGMETERATQLTGLLAGTVYHYEVRASGTVIASSKFRTTPPPGSPFRFAAFGDSGIGVVLPHQKLLAALMLERDPDLIIHTGDVVYPEGAQKHYEEKYFSPYKRLGARAVAYLSLGNHDVKTDDGAPYLANFVLPRNNPPKNERYYSFDYGDVHFVALDSTKDLGPGTVQGDWLDADLAATGQRWKIVFWHHAMYSSGRHGSNAGIKLALEATLIARGVDLALVGHDHIYERSKPIEGVVHIVTGGGGAPPYPLKTENDWTAVKRSEWHFTDIRVSTAKLEIEAVDFMGNVFDTHTITK